MLWRREGLQVRECIANSALVYSESLDIHYMHCATGMFKGSLNSYCECAHDIHFIRPGTMYIVYTQTSWHFEGSVNADRRVCM